VAPGPSSAGGALAHDAFVFSVRQRSVNEGGWAEKVQAPEGAWLVEVNEAVG